VNHRIKKLISLFEEQRLDSFLVTDSADISYLTCFPSEEAWLLIFAKRAYYLTDSRYVLQARQGLKGVSVKQCQKSLIDSAVDLVNGMKIKRLGFDPRHVSLFTYQKLRYGCANKVSLEGDQKGLIGHLREIKSPQETRKIKEAIALTHEAYRYLGQIIKPGITEYQIFLKLEQFVKKLGYSFSFDPIIASGPNSCHPHAKITHRKVHKNDVVLVDMGIDVQGYKSDLTRMFFLGKIPALIKEFTELVGAAQDAAIDRIQPGVKASIIDQQARNFFKKRKLSKYFGHALGHGVGLEVHERPRISQKSQAILKPGMIFTIEPAVYIPNKFGIRIEDMVLVTQKGHQILSR